MKRIVFVAMVAALSLLVFTGCIKAKTKEIVLTVGATPVPHAAILNLIADDLALEGITLKVVEFTDYVTPNEAVETGQIDANFFQHVPYQDTFNKEKGYHLVSVAGIHVEPLAVYSKKFTKLADLPSGATIALPNDPTNEGRALLLLQAAGLITVKSEAGLTATSLDLASNPKNLNFKPVEAALLARILPDVDAAVINGNYAIPAGLAAARDGLYVEGKDSPYVNIITVKAGNETDVRIQALVKAVKSQKDRKSVV